MLLLDEKRLLRDIGDGILVLSNSGEIRLLNDSAQRLLGLAGDYEGKKYLAVIEDNDCEGNDEFHQMLIDAVSDKKVLHRRKLRYTEPSRKIRHLIVKSSAYDSQIASECSK